MTGPVSRVAIVGRDAAAWLTALALARALGRSGVRIEVVELPSLLTAVDVYSAVPSLAGLHRLLGLDEAEVLRACDGVPVAGQRFAGWNGDAPAFLHAYDTQRMAIDDLDFLQFWVKARGEGLRVAFEDFSPAAAAAKQGRLGNPDGEFGALSALPRGYHLDARSYVYLVRGRALRGGVAHRTARSVAVERDGARLACVTADDGAIVAADLFVDASGAEVALIGGMPGAEMEPWADGLGIDRILAASAPPLRPLPAFAQIAAHDAGWMGMFPLESRTALVAAYASAAMSDGEALRMLAAASQGQAGGDAFAAPFAAGLRPSWIGNVVAIGEAAAGLEPLDGVQLHPVHVGVSNLVALFPVDAGRMPEAAVYNRIVGAHLRNVRDFQFAHYRLNGRIGRPFWDAARATAGSDALRAKIALFASRGLVALGDEEAFQETNWAASFVGHGLIPLSYDPLVDRLPPEEQADRIRQLLGAIAKEVRGMPTVEAYLAARSGAASRPA